MRQKLIITLMAPTMLLSGVASAHDSAGSNLFLRVGPGVAAASGTEGMRYMCGDGNCQFAMPRNSTFDIIAEAGTTHQVQWNGCASQSERRCHVEIRDNPVSISVR